MLTKLTMRKMLLTKTLAGIKKELYELTIKNKSVGTKLQEIKYQLEMIKKEEQKLRTMTFRLIDKEVKLRESQEHAENEVKELNKKLSKAEELDKRIENS